MCPLTYTPVYPADQSQTDHIQPHTPTPGSRISLLVRIHGSSGPGKSVRKNLRARPAAPARGAGTQLAQQL